MEITFFLTRWLIDLVVSSGLDTVKCLWKCKGDVTVFLAQSDLLNLCEKVLQVIQAKKQTTF